ncbi:MAG: ABC transporter ATP-binding protein [Anaerolineales bacterium]|nr:ABC transporter ATP-binding protein [Anaerolineales bacterium]
MIGENEEINIEIAEFSLSQQFVTNKKSAYYWIGSHFLRYWYLIFMVVIGAFGNAALMSVVPVQFGKAFDIMLTSKDNLKLLIPIVWIIGISQVFRGVLQFSRNYGAEIIGQLVERNIREELYVNLLGKSMTFHNLQPVGDIMARATNDVREVNFMFSPGFNLIIGSVNFLIMPLLLAPRYNPQLIIVPAIFFVLYFLALWQYLHEMAPITEDIREKFSTMNVRLTEALDGIETVKGMSQEEDESVLFLKNAREFRDAFIQQGNVEAKFFPLLLMSIAMAAGLLHALLLFNQGLITTGDVVAYFGLLNMFGFPIFASRFAYSQVSLGMASAKRILHLINLKNDLDQNVDGYENEMCGEVEFRGTEFGFTDQEPVLTEISFKVKPGQRVAIVGQTGVGKTSLVKLVNRTYDVTAGQILIDGVDVKDWKLDALRKSVSIIEQDIFLFSRTIEENIAFGCPKASHKEVVAAAKMAQADEFIREFKDEYQTVIGERGVTLSGGQRQRLALARAFLTDPKILILDDSTSAIDSATEDRIQKAIYSAAEGRTTLIITHRLSQIRWADLILVLQNGRLVAQGSHDQLLQSSKAYRQIFTE